MSDKIKIGDGEYLPPFRQDNYDSDWFVDAESNMLDNDDIVVALNELAALRQERDELVKRVEELEVDLKAVTMKVDERMIRVEFTSGKYRMVKFYTRLELRHSQSFPRVEKDFVQFCQETATKDGE